MSSSFSTFVVFIMVPALFSGALCITVIPVLPVQNSFRKRRHAKKGPLPHFYITIRHSSGYLSPLISNIKFGTRSPLGLTAVYLNYNKIIKQMLMTGLILFHLVRKLIRVLRDFRVGKYSPITNSDYRL